MTNGLRQRLAFVGVVGTLLALSGLYGTSSVPFYGRWLYWTSLILVRTWLGAAIFNQLGPATRTMPWIARWLVFSFALTVPMIGMVSIAQAAIGAPIAFAYYPDVGVKVWLVTAAVSGARLVRNPDPLEGDRPDPLPAASAALAETPPEPRLDTTADPQLTSDSVEPAPQLVSRLKPSLRDSAILALSAEDHYVRVYTADGDDLLLLRLSDAIAQTRGLDGQQIHRSWWIAREGVSEIRKRTEGGTAILKNGVEAPISRARFKELKAAGWV
ncbi:MAG: LytTR family DNA-binding domain-containing protein [Pseudomonadota bacterium]